MHPSPSDKTDFGRQLLAQDPDHPGSLGIAISEAVAMAVEDPTTRYALGSVLNHVLLHQTIIGEEALLQLAKVGEQPDVLVGCTGGGSNFGGLSFPFLREKLKGNMNPTIRCVEPAACPSMSKGEYRYDFGDTAGMTPLVKMHTLGHNFIPDPIHAGGLRYTACRRWFRTCTRRTWSRLRRSARPNASPVRCSSPAPKASSPPLSRPMRLRLRSVRPTGPRRRAKSV